MVSAAVFEADDDFLHKTVDGSVGRSTNQNAHLPRSTVITLLIRTLLKRFNHRTTIPNKMKYPCRYKLTHTHTFIYTET